MANEKYELHIENSLINLFLYNSIHLRSIKMWRKIMVYDLDEMQ